MEGVRAGRVNAGTWTEGELESERTSLNLGRLQTRWICPELGGKGIIVDGTADPQRVHFY